MLLKFTLTLLLHFVRVAVAGPGENTNAVAQIAEQYGLSVTANVQDVLATAVEQMDADSIQTLARNGANVNAPMPDGTSYLYKAVLKGSTAPVRALLKAGADPNALLWDGDDLLDAAVKEGDRDRVKAIVKAYLDTRIDQGKASNAYRLQFSQDATTYDLGLVVARLRENTPINQHICGDEHLIWYAMNTQNVDIIKLLTGYGLRVAERNNPSVNKWIRVSYRFRNGAAMEQVIQDALDRELTAMQMH